VKPELRTSDVVCSWPYVVRYFWVLLWGYLDDFGRGLDIPKTIAGDCFPKDDEITAKTIGGWLDLMTRGVGTEPGPVCRYVVGRGRYVHAINWPEHQHPARPTPSRLPPCPLHDTSLHRSEPLNEPLNEPLIEPLNDKHGARSERSTDTRGARSESAAATHGARSVIPTAVGSSSVDVGSSSSSDALHRSEQPAARTRPADEPPPTAAAAVKIIRQATGCTAAEAIHVGDLVRAERKPRNLPGLLKRMADDGELSDWLARIRAAQAEANLAEIIAEARRGPVCEHGDPGGDFVHPIGGEPLCPGCRLEARKAAA
jgi:hypothetical protein